MISTREEEAIGIATGMVLSGEKSLVFMQNAGFANSLSTITSLLQLYQIPIILLIGWRGFLKDDAPEHEKIGKIQPELLKNLDVNSIKLVREGDTLSFSSQFIDAEALIDEGGYGFEPSLYIIGYNQNRVCKIVEDLAKSMEAMS